MADNAKKGIREAWGFNFMKSYLRFSKASGSTRRKVERIARRGHRAIRRAVTAGLRQNFKSGGSNGE
jgi:hypothetical protein